MREVFIEDLFRVFAEGAGRIELDQPVSELMDTPFSAIGYDSLAMLETASRLEREYGVTLSDDDVNDAKTPRLLLQLVNAAQTR
ncbi:actinorhodin polyketide synthase acyl carrier protein [Kitasatospora phosalacinea]|uniref:Actinorhodin polyketide synthase acyl carrier protein n=1 Tax=Kitasatospora phosalacinea TaxID=2065 RepID=A0A9W6V5M7_9ACTN|nr:acyl carrier protein [Kitasatospora phosalacinea]GLW74448.1 actinorhodin polyketide synthase acyl carrier protein [Kitasatospora phosalacinea]